MAKRLFIALELPAGCRETLAAMAEPICGARWVAAGQLHLTLAFLGNVDAEHESLLRDNLAELRVPSFSLRLCGVEMFRARRRATIWAGVDDGREGLLALHADIHRALKAAHIKLKPARFHPHVTLARVKDPDSHKLRCFLQSNQSREFGMIELKDFTLFSSTLEPIGAIHHVVERYALVSH
jgi:2'-5' RNA ligase